MRRLPRASVRPARTALAFATALASTLVFIPAGHAAGLPPVSLLGDFHGTYRPDGTMNDESMEIRVEQQHKRVIKKARLFAQDLSEFVGKGRISKDNTSAKIAFHTFDRGKFRSRMPMTITIADAGATMTGAYTITRRDLAPRSGTLTVAK